MSFLKREMEKLSFADLANTLVDSLGEFLKRTGRLALKAEEIRLKEQDLKHRIENFELEKQAWDKHHPVESEPTEAEQVELKEDEAKDQPVQGT